MEQRRSGIGEVWPRGSGIPKRRYGTKAYHKGGMEQRHTKKEVWNRGIPKRRYGTGELRYRRSGTGGSTKRKVLHRGGPAQEVRYRFTI